MNEQDPNQKISELFKQGIQRVRIERGPDGKEHFLTEPLPPEAGPEIVLTPMGMVSKDEAVAWFNEPDQHTVVEKENGMTFDEEKSVVDRIHNLKEWWLQKAADDVTMVAEKAVVYGSNSLEQLGRKMAQLNGRKDVSSEEAQELGCWVYLIGKAERWTDAVMRGERPKDDTILDIATYATMAARIRQAGGWPDSES